MQALNANRSVSDGEEPLRVLVCPSRLPPDTSRTEKNDRLVQISSAVEDLEYNQMVPRGSAVHRKSAVPLRWSSRGCEGEHAAGGRAPETLAVFMKDVSVGLDMRLMTIAGGIVGYYVCHIRGMEQGQCIIGAGVAAVVMLFVDAVLLVIRMGKEDLLSQKKIGSLVERRT
jgi:hypothetical protein